MQDSVTRSTPIEPYGGSKINYLNKDLSSYYVNKHTMPTSNQHDTSIPMFHHEDLFF